MGHPCGRLSPLQINWLCHFSGISGFLSFQVCVPNSYLIFLPIKVRVANDFLSIIRDMGKITYGVAYEGGNIVGSVQSEITSCEMN